MSLERISERIAEQIVDLFLVEAFKNFAQDIFHPLLCMFLFAIKKAWMSLVKGFSALFTPKKKCALESEGATLAAQLEDAPVPDSIEWVELFDDIKSKTNYWNRRTRLSSWLPPVGIKVFWVGTQDEEGVFHYWHRDTRVSTYDFSFSSSWVMGGEVRGLASPHPILGATTSLRPCS